MVLSWPLTKRRDYLYEIERFRGEVGRKYLEDEIWRQWELKKQLAAPRARPVKS